MSFEAMAWAVRQELPCQQKIVLVMLADRVNKDTGLCCPSMDRLAKDCGLSKSSVKQAIRALREKGLVAARRRTDGTTNLSNEYFLPVNSAEGGSGGGASDTPVVGNSGAPDDGVGREAPQGGACGARGVGRETPPNLEGEPVREPERARATRLPDDWQLPRAWGLWAQTEGGLSEATVRREADKFRDHWHAAGGQNARKRDWQATWRNWVRRVPEFGRAGTQGRGPGGGVVAPGDTRTLPDGRQQIYDPADGWLETA